MRYWQDGTLLMPERREILEREAGHYDDDGFYILEAGGFYDPHGYHFGKDDLDETGGFYDAEGYYTSPNDFEDAADLREDEHEQD